jgi:hypothetical protein
MEKVTIREDDCIRNIHFLKVVQSDLELSSWFFAAEMYVYNGFNIVYIFRSPPCSKNMGERPHCWNTRRTCVDHHGSPWWPIGPWSNGVRGHQLKALIVQASNRFCWGGGKSRIYKSIQISSNPSFTGGFPISTIHLVRGFPSSTFDYRAVIPKRSHLWALWSGLRADCRCDSSACRAFCLAKTQQIGARRHPRLTFVIGIRLWPRFLDYIWLYRETGGKTRNNQLISPVPWMLQTPLFAMGAWAK